MTSIKSISQENSLYWYNGASYFSLHLHCTLPSVRQSLVSSEDSLKSVKLLDDKIMKVARVILVSLDISLTYIINVKSLHHNHILTSISFARQVILLLFQMVNSVVANF